MATRLRFKKLRLQLWFRQQGVCYWCQCDMHFGKGDRCDRTYATIDHLKTKSQGRKGYMEGGHVLACRSCNVERNRQEMFEMRNGRQCVLKQYHADRIWAKAIASKRS